jgi:hypothetical protein
VDNQVRRFTFAGGYARNVENTVTIHCNTVVVAKNVFSA